MKFVVRSKDTFKGKHITTAVGMPLLTSSYFDRQDLPESPGYYVIMPTDRESNPYCEVHIVMDGAEDWQIEGRDNGFSNRFLKDDEFVIVDDSFDEDLYYVWDDGAEERMERARRLYQRLKQTLQEYEKRS